MWAYKKKAAKHAGVSRPTLDIWIKNGLPCRKLDGCYLIRLEDVDNYIIERGETKSEIDKAVDGLMKKLL